MLNKLATKHLGLGFTFEGRDGFKWYLSTHVVTSFSTVIKDHQVKNLNWRAVG
jgi:hypothetical protein